eukprot:Awhi_evm1s10184
MSDNNNNTDVNNSEYQVAGSETQAHNNNANINVPVEPKLLGYIHIGISIMSLGFITSNLRFNWYIDRVVYKPVVVDDSFS